MIKKLVLLLLGIGLTSCGFGEKDLVYVSSCSLDSVAGANKNGDREYTASTNSVLAFSGWAADVEGEKTPSSVQIQLIDGNLNVYKLAEGKPNFDRPDVANAFNKPKISMSGYNISMDPKQLPLGKYRIEIIQVFENVKAVCPSNNNLTIN